MKKKIMLLLTATLTVNLLTGCGTANNNANIETVDVVVATESLEPTGTIEKETTLEETTAETTEEETTESEEETTEEVTEETTEVIIEPEETFTYTDMSATLYATQSVNLRNLPDTSGEKLGSLVLNQEVSVTGKCVETGWYRINYNGGEAYVSNKYLSDSKIEVKVEQPVANNTPESTPVVSNDTAPESNVSTTNSGNPYELYVWHDMGSYFVLFAQSYDDLKTHFGNGGGWHVTGVDEAMSTLQERYPDRSVISEGQLDVYGTFAFYVNICDMGTGVPTNRGKDVNAILP